VHESAQAEARLTAAINRLFAWLDTASSAGLNENLVRMKTRWADEEARVAVLVEAYNRRAEVFNTLLTRGPARLFTQLAMFKAVESYV
jgi:hypothetical protein